MGLLGSQMESFCSFKGIATRINVNIRRREQEKKSSTAANGLQTAQAIKRPINNSTERVWSQAGFDCIEVKSETVAGSLGPAARKIIFRRGSREGTRRRN